MSTHSAPKAPIIPDRWARYLYPIALAVVLLLAAYGIIDEHLTTAWTALAAAVLGIGTVDAHRRNRRGGE